MVVLGLKWLYPGKRGCVQESVVLIGQKRLYSGKVVVFGQIGCFRLKVVVFGQNLL